MSAPQFTPGPWYLTGEDDRRYIREEASDACIALMLDGGHVDPKFAMPEREIAANANLLAAAPEVYAAALAMLDAYDSDCFEGERNALDRALAKARGEQVPA